MKNDHEIETDVAAAEAAYAAVSAAISDESAAKVLVKSGAAVEVAALAAPAATSSVSTSCAFFKFDFG